MRVLDGIPQGILSCAVLAVSAGLFALPASAQTAQNQAAPGQAASSTPATTKPAAAAKPANKPQAAQQAQAPRVPGQIGQKGEKVREPVSAKGCARITGKPYFVEFRARTAASYGHTFVFHGKLGSGAKFASFKVAGLHPKGDDPSIYIQGHFAPVEAETGVSFGDLDEQYLTARFCVPLTEAEYRRAEAYIRNLQATSKTWHAPTYNCNSFAADIAKHIGLDTPNPNMYLPEQFIKRLADDNAKEKNGASFPSFSSMQWGSPQKPAAR